MARYLAQCGWRITVVTSAVQTPELSSVENVRVIRVKCGSFSRKSILSRVMGYFLTYPLFLLRMIRLPRHSVVVLKTDPPLLQLIGPPIRWIKGSQLVHWAQDVYPEVAAELGVIKKKSLFLKALLFLSTLCLKQYNAIICVGRCMQSVLESRGLDSQKIAVIPNWSRDRFIYPVERYRNSFVEEHQLKDRFVVMYSGNFGLAHQFEGWIDVCNEVGKCCPRVLFLFVGDGPGMESIKDRMDQLDSDSVRFLPFQPLNKLAESLSSAHVHWVNMKSNLSGLVVPSKGYAAFGAGKPVVFIGPESSELAMCILESGAGKVIASGEPTAISKAIIEYVESPEALHQATQAAEGLAKNWNLQTAGQAFEKAMNQLIIR